jgi:hypothetical protein
MMVLMFDSINEVCSCGERMMTFTIALIALFALLLRLIIETDYRDCSLRLIILVQISLKGLTCLTEHYFIPVTTIKPTALGLTSSVLRGDYPMNVF